MTEATGNDRMMTADQAVMFARGLYALASTDGIDPRETALIREFLAEMGDPAPFSAVTEGAFDPAAAAVALDTSFLRRVFLRTAIVLIRADGTVSPSERNALAKVAVAFGMGDSLDEIFAETEGLVID